MELYLKSVAGILIVSVFCLYLSKQGKDISALLALLACCMVTIGAFFYLSPVIDFIFRLQDLGNLNSDMLGVILKAVGIAMLSEITHMVCADAGNASLGKTVQIMGLSVVLWISLPVFRSLLEILEEVLASV